MSLLDYNNTILKENKLFKYIFNITDLQFLNYFKTNPLNIHSSSINSNNILIIDNEPLSILENNSDLSSSPDNSYLSDISNNSYPSVNSLDSYISFDDEKIYEIKSTTSNDLDSTSSEDSESNSSSDSISFNGLKEHFTNKEINFDYIEYDSEQSNLSELILESKNTTPPFHLYNSTSFHNISDISRNSNNIIYKIIKYDYDKFYNYLTNLDLIKDQNLHLYNKLQNRGLYLNLHIIQNGFFELLEYYENKN